MENKIIQAKQNGPYLIAGPLTVIDEQGQETEINQETVALCRCGSSGKKPFCDGSHRKVNFEAAQVTIQQK